ncbi:MAG: M15 family metallopeptidase [Prevotellaceae bacterium]|nr:M15 family metallopeptidase [Prevotellaceae bacterium]
MLLLSVALLTCKNAKMQDTNDDFSASEPTDTIPYISIEHVIVDCNYTFEEATMGTTADEDVIRELELIQVQYYSTDGKLHQGQILCNRKIAQNIVSIFEFIKELKFPVAHAIPIVRYGWDEELSMQANNTYSFCYRHISYSKHASGMAIDINPYFNPLRWKTEKRPNRPEGAEYNPEIPGTFYRDHPVVVKFQRMGFLWGNTFTRYYDDNHFEKK